MTCGNVELPKSRAGDNPAYIFLLQKQLIMILNRKTN